MITSGELLRWRICELLESWQPWHRRLWDLGTVLALREAVEAADWVSRQVLSPAAVSWYLRESLLPRLGTDAAIGDGQIRGQLREVCGRSLKSGTCGQRSLALLADLVEDGYLRRWQRLINSGADFNIERAARCVASHMLDRGFHQDHLHAVVKTELPRGADLADLLALFIELEGRGERSFSGFVVLQGRIPALDSAQGSAQWMSREEVSVRLAADAPGHESIRATGGLRFDVSARDPHSAAQEITEVFDRLRNRIRYRRGEGNLAAAPMIFIAGQSRPFPFLRGDPAVTLVSLERAGVLYDAHVTGEEGSRIDDALELAAPLTGSSPSTAVAGAWAALESLLFCDTDEADRAEGRAVAADRAAGLVAAGWPRAELTALSYRKGLLADARLRTRLDRAGGENRARVEAMLHWLNSSPSLPDLGPGDTAALHRMRGLVERPRPTLGRVNGHLRGALRRLYRQRNIVLHGGSTRSVALRASLRTAGPLVGAALDRVAHGYVACDIPPLELASRAQLAVRVVDDPSAWGLHELLGT